MTDTTSTTTVTFDLARWDAERKAHNQRAEAIRPANKEALFDALAAADITSVIATFDGYGDSGQIESINVMNGGIDTNLPDVTIPIASIRWRESEPRTEIMTVRAAIEQLAYDFLAETHCGWENNDGAFGEFVFDVEERTITLEHNDRYTAIESYSHQF